MYHVPFPEVLLALQQEIFEHPNLLAILNANVSSTDGWEQKLAHVAAYCGVELDGYYDEADIQLLGKLLLQKLQSRRMPEIITSN